MENKKYTGTWKAAWKAVEATPAHKAYKKADEAVKATPEYKAWEKAYVKASKALEELRKVGQNEKI